MRLITLLLSLIVACLLLRISLTMAFATASDESTPTFAEDKQEVEGTKEDNGREVGGEYAAHLSSGPMYNTLSSSNSKLADASTEADDEAMQPEFVYAAADKNDDNRWQIYKGPSTLAYSKLAIGEADTADKNLHVSSLSNFYFIFNF